MNILIIVAHPDDEVLGMGGTILKHANKGDKVTIAYLTTGITARRSSNYQNASVYETNESLKSQMKNQIDELGKDVREACKFLKVKKTFFFNLPDNELDTIPLLKIIKIIKNLIKEIKPERIYTSHYGDLNIDHRIVSDATLTACKSTRFPVKEIMCFEILSSTEWAFPYQFKPNYFISIKGELDKKIKAMQAYKNEIKEFPHPRSVENIKNTAHKWGIVSGLHAAEAFELIRKFEK